ncbi:hypothetical protein GCM10010420_31330 [Streptomyces glaucosporus]|uniref:Uncharacterized protein n=1 Tax=Streptomyces glaucosporus TaxID=284044 RepID=A0ABN3IDW7_9ACTN
MPPEPSRAVARGDAARVAGDGDLSKGAHFAAGTVLCRAVGRAVAGFNGSGGAATRGPPATIRGRGRRERLPARHR